ncbi:TonB-dependent receptor plug domain-containing protein [Roseateles sp. UC29_93]|uniref:TonB-dependent receptor plug domain-containing protein n=1 Tax=Roseateles sp. UC29_93 TaxID=3350177 RepID=UPI00366F1B1E
MRLPSPSRSPARPTPSRPPAAAASAAATSPSADDSKKLERVEITGTLIKRTDKETPSVVQSITREDIRNSGYANVEELLRANSAVDLGSIGDGAASGFVGGLSTISLRGFGSQGTLILINGRRTAPVAAVDVNFGRGTMINVNTIPKEAIERIDILKDGASAMYGSDAMAGVINYILRKDYQGIEGSASYGANDQGVGATKNGAITFGFGNLATQRFNVFGGLEVSKRDSVMANELKDRGNLALQNQYLTSNGSLARFTPDSSASFYGNYYRVPTSLTGSTTIGGISVANNSLSGANYLGTRRAARRTGLSARACRTGPRASCPRPARCRRDCAASASTTRTRSSPSRTARAAWCAAPSRSTTT